MRPEPADEGTHPPGPEELWNESWYFDAVSDDGALGVYTRTGLLPNQDAVVHVACLCGPDRPTVLLTEPDAAQRDCREPLKRFHVSMAGTGQAHDDHAAILREEPGRQSTIALDLEFETAGVPYQWPHSTRYEIPCRVAGTVTVDGEEIAFSGPGQRDHSWGVRDWWDSDWMWSALHLDDGTHVHAVGVPGHPRFGVGYVQRDGELTELGAVATDQRVGADGLVTHDTLRSGDELDLEVESLAYGPVLLRAPDGRTSHFVRAMCRATTADGRSGTGWVEWNRNQPPSA